TIWYRFTPSSSAWLSVTGGGTFGNASVFRSNGGGLFTLSFITCTAFNGQALVLAQAGSTDYFPVMAPRCSVAGALPVSVQEVPAPVPQANFGFNPIDPSAFDFIQCFDESFDPGQQQIRSRRWDFGDGTTADTTCCPTHRYGVDGTFTIKLTV